MNKAQMKKQNNEHSTHEYNLEQYKQHYFQLLQYSQIIDNKSKQQICEKIELICEFSVWGDQNNSDFFDFFFEENIAENFFKIMQRSSFKDIIIVIIQSFGMLLANLSNKENVNYLLSHPVIQDLIMYNYDFTDEEVVDYYISLLKSLALRIDEANLQLFFNQRMSLFPLLWQATKFYNHKEIMVRTAVRTIILGVMKIQNPLLKKYLTRFPFAIFYVHFSCHLKNVWLETNREVLDSKTDVKEKLDDLVDIFYFLNDIYAFCPEISDILDNALLIYTIIPAMLGGILYQKKETLAISFTLHLANHLIRNFHATHLAKSLVLLLFSPSLQSNVNQLLENNIRLPRSFLYSWSFRNFWDQHLEALTNQANQLFDIQSYSINDETEDCVEEMKIINDVLGLRGAIGVTYCCKQLLQNNGNELMVANKIRSNLLLYLQTKDDSFLYLLLNLVKTVLLFSDKEVLRTCLFQDANTTEIIAERNNIIVQLLSIFQIDPALRLSTLIVATQIILHLTSIDKLVLESSTINELYNIYYYSVTKMIAMLKQNQYHDAIVTQYQVEFNKYHTNLKVLNPNLDYLAFIPILDKYDPNIDLMYRQPVGLREIAIRDLAIFLMIDLIFTSLVKLNAEGNDQEQKQSENPTNDWKIGQNYEPPNNCKLLSCRISAKTIKDKLQNCTSGECFWLEDEQNFIIIETQIVKKEWAHILYHAKISNIEAIIDRSEPRKLNVNIKVQSMLSIKESYQDVQILFDDYTYSAGAKRHIDNMRKGYSKKAAQIVEAKVHSVLQICKDHISQQQPQQQ